MKVTNLRQRFEKLFAKRRKQGRQLAAVAVVAGGTFFAGSAHAIEAVVNGSFEQPSPAGWVGGFGTYNHTTSVYYEGPAPAGAGDLYGWDPGITAPQIATQTISLAAGIGDIDAGTAAYDFNAWLSSWTGDTNYTILSLDWKDSTTGGGSQVGATITFDGDDGLNPNLVGSADANGLADAGVAWTQDNWSFYQSAGNIPVGSRSAVLTYQGVSNDAYLDLVSLDLPFATLPPNMEIVVNRDTGAIELQNNTGVPQGIRGYSIRSPAGALIEGNHAALSDSDSDWVLFTAPGATGDLSEGHLSTGSISTGATIQLDNGVDGAWRKYFNEDDVRFEYLDGSGSLVDGEVSFTGTTQTAPYAFGDLTFDGAVNGLDWVAYAAGLGTDLSGQSDAESYAGGDLNGDQVNNHTDFLLFRTAYDAVNGAGAFAALTAGVPEPATCLLLAAGGFGWISRRPRRPRE